MLAWLLASRLMLHFGPIQALGHHGRGLIITVKDDRSVITVLYMPGPALVINASPAGYFTVSSRYVWNFDRFIAPRVGGHCLMQP